MDKGLIPIAGALSMSAPSKCTSCWCSNECEAVGGETLCGLMRLYYIHKLKNQELCKKLNLTEKD